MLKNILLAVAIVAFLLTSNLQAQSSSKKGSSSRSSYGSSSSSSAAKQERLMKKEIDKMAGKIERKEFAGIKLDKEQRGVLKDCLLYTSPSPRDRTRSRMPSSA